MSDHVPAWKKIGLKVKETLENDPLSLATHLDSGKVTKKQAKQINKRKSNSDAGDNKEKKPPKRQKLPKLERPPPPEKDQLVYLKTYTTDRDNWKFSKQKQNWILKNIRDIHDEYEEYIVNYLVGVQGGSRERVLEDLYKVVEIWNKAAKEEPSGEKEAEEQEDEENAKEELTDNKTAKETKAQSEGKKKDEESVDADYAIRAKRIIKAMTEVDVELIGIDEPEDKSSNPEDKFSDPTKTGKKIEEQPKNNLVVEQVEVTDFVGEEDYEDENVKTNEEYEKKSKEGTEELVKDDKEKVKKAKKDKKKKKKTKKEKKSTQE